MKGEIPFFDSEALGGGIFYQATTKDAAEYVRSRLHLVDKRQERIEKNAESLAVRHLGRLMKPISELFVCQLERGRASSFLAAKDVAPEIVGRIQGQIKQDLKELPSVYRPILQRTSCLFEVTSRAELVELNTELEHCMYDFYINNPDLPLLMVIGATDSNIGQAEPEVYLAMPDHALEQQFGPWRQRVQDLHPRFRRGLHKRPMILQVLAAGGWGVGSVSCGQAFSEANTFYLFPQAIKELPLAGQIFEQLGETKNDAGWYQSLIYVLHEQAHHYYPKIKKIYSESGPDANTLEILLNWAISNPLERKKIIASLAVAYHKDVFFDFSSPAMKAYVNSSTMCYEALVGSGLLSWDDNQVRLSVDTKRLERAYSYVKHQREQLDRTKAWIVPPLPEGLEKMFELWGMPT